MSLAHLLDRSVDATLDRTLVGFSQVGLAVRRRLPGWPADPEPGALVGQDVAVTGATSGLGLATALGVARLGARVRLVVRSPEKAKAVIARIEAEVPDAVVTVHRCDVSDLDDVRRFAAALGEELAGAALHGLVHNAGVMPPEWTGSAQDHELTMAVHVLGPVLMTDLLRPHLAVGARVVMVTSGGMYAQRLRADDPEYRSGDYSPTTAYARSKRAQVELLAHLNHRWAGAGIRAWAMHPGWADTPGVLESLPTFHRLMGPVLRDADGGADTTTWLLATQPAPRSGGLWHDRRRRREYVAPRTSPGSGDVDEMWRWVLGATGLEE